MEEKKQVEVLSVDDLMKKNKSEFGYEMAEYSGGYISDNISEIADSQIDYGWCNLLDWAKHHYSSIDEAVNEFGFPNDKDDIIEKLIQQGQYHYYEQTIFNEISEIMEYYCFSYILNDLGIETLTREQVDEIENYCYAVSSDADLYDFIDFCEELCEVGEDDDEE